MDITIPIDGYAIPESRTFAHSTRMADSWRAAPEEVVQPEMRVGAAEVSLKVFDGSTSQLGNVRRTRNPIKMLHRYQTMDLSGRYVYDARYEVDTNVGHYIVDTIPKILVARTAIAADLGKEIDIHAVLREGSSKLSREVFANFGIPVVVTEADVVGRIVKTSEVVPRTSSIGSSFLSGQGTTMVGKLRETYSSFRGSALGTKPGGPERIFVSRKSSRTIENEAEITDLLKTHGFERYYFETGELSVIEQWRIMSGARQIVAIHGAGLTPLIFNTQGLAQVRGDLSGLRIVELHGAGYFVDFNRRLAAVMNAHWCGVRGKISPEIVRDLDDRGGARVHQSSSFRVDPQALELALKYSASVDRHSASQ